MFTLAISACTLNNVPGLYDWDLGAPRARRVVAEHAIRNHYSKFIIVIGFCNS
jgi:hypothetical protein